MPPLRVYDVFISHAWHRGEHYARVVEWLNTATNFRWRNLSVPEHDPVDDNRLESALRDELRPAHVFLIIAGMYAAHSTIIRFELEWARILGKPIIALVPRGNVVLPSDIQRQARAIVGWTQDGLVQAIRDHAL